MFKPWRHAQGGLFLSHKWIDTCHKAGIVRVHTSRTNVPHTAALDCYLRRLFSLFAHNSKVSVRKREEKKGREKRERKKGKERKERRERKRKKEKGRRGRGKKNKRTSR